MLGNFLDQRVNLPEEAMSKSILEPGNLDPGIHATSEPLTQSHELTSRCDMLQQDTGQALVVPGNI